jgi:hypothetical protein
MLEGTALEKKIAKFDMLKSKDRQAFVDVRRLIADRCPPPQTSPCPKHKDLLRIQRLHNGGRQRGNVKTLVEAKSPLSEELRKDIAKAESKIFRFFIPRLLNIWSPIVPRENDVEHNTSAA